MTYPSDLYEVRLYDEDSNFVTILQGWSVLEYWQRLNAPWNHTIRYDLSYDDPRLDILRSIGPDWFYLIYRTDPITLDKDKVWEGFHQTTVDQARENGDIILTLYGQGYTEWLNRRVIIPPVADWEVHEVTAAAGTAIKEYVAFNMLTGSVPDADRAMPGFAVAAGPDGGTTVTYSPRYTNLLTACQTLAEDGNVKFGIIGTDDPPVTFALYTREIWGLDRRINSTKPDKGDPMLFDFMKKNMDIPILSKNYSEQKTVVYVAGTGVGIKRKLLELSNLTALAESPRIRKESYIDSRGAETNAEMLTVGRSYLEKNAAKKSVTFNLRQNESTRWMRDFDLGDIVTAKYFDHLESKEIAEIHVTVNTSRDTTFIERIDVEMNSLSDAMVEYLAEWTIDYEDPYPFQPVVEVGPWSLFAGTQKIAMFRTDGYVYRTSDFDAVNPTWSRVNLSVTGQPANFVVDAFSPGYVGGGTDINGWLFTTSRIYRVTDIFGAVSATLQHTLSESFAAWPPSSGDYQTHAMADASFGVQGHVVLAWSNSGTRTTRAAYTTNSGTTWTEVLVAGAATNAPLPGCYVSSKTAGLVYVTGGRTGLNGGAIYKSTDYGATWTRITAHGPQSPYLGLNRRGSGELHVPYQGNNDENIAYYCWFPGDNFDNNELHRILADGSAGGISPVPVSREVAPWRTRWGIVSSFQNRNYMAMCGQGGWTSDPWYLYISTDAGSTWTLRQSSSGYRRVAIAGDTNNVLYLWGAHRSVGYSVDFGVTLQSKTGNLADFIGPKDTNNEFVGICGG